MFHLGSPGQLLPGHHFKYMYFQRGTAEVTSQHHLKVNSTGGNSEELDQKSQNEGESLDRSRNSEYTEGEHGNSHKADKNLVLLG